MFRFNRVRVDVAKNLELLADPIPGAKLFDVMRAMPVMRAVAPVAFDHGDPDRGTIARKHQTPFAKRSSVRPRSYQSNRSSAHALETFPLSGVRRLHLARIRYYLYYRVMPNPDPI